MRVVPMVAAVAVVAMGLSLGGDLSRREVARDPAVTFVVADASLGYAQEMSMGFAAGAAEVPGVESNERGSAVGDTTNQLATARDVLDQGQTGVSLFTWNPELLAQAGGPRVIAVHMPPALGSGIRLYIGNDDYQLGQMLGEQLATMIPFGMRGTIILGTSVPGALALDRRGAGVRDWLNRVRPRLNILGPFDTKQDPAASQEAWTTLLRANPYAVAFVGIGDNDAATLARLRASSNGGWLAGGFGVDDMALAAVRRGNFALVSPELYVQGAVAGRLQAAAARGDALPDGWLVTPGKPIRAADVPAVLSWQSSARTRAVWAKKVVDDLVTNAPAHLRPLEDVQGSLG
jgi:ribose transport system substrate-binding protein